MKDKKVAAVCMIFSLMAFAGIGMVHDYRANHEALLARIAALEREVHELKAKPVMNALPPSVMFQFP